MSSRPQLNPESVITNGNLSGNLTSLVTIITKLSMVTYATSWSGTSPVGTLNVQVSNDYSQNGDGSVKNAGTWSTVTTGAVSGNTGTGFFDITTGAYAIRLTYTFSSGTGTIQALVAAKVS